ncbi:MAG: hypothetical protein ACQER2_01675 [Bacillota bacterium]
MIRFERTRKLAYSSFGTAILIVLIILINLQKSMINMAFQSILTMAAVFFGVIGVALLAIVKDAEESIHALYQSGRHE